jgi:hypothetical protein
MEVSGQLHAPAALPPIKNLGGTHWSVGGPQRRSGRFGEEKIIIPPPGFKPRIVQPLSESLY